MIFLVLFGIHKKFFFRRLQVALALRDLAEYLNGGHFGIRCIVAMKHVLDAILEEHGTGLGRVTKRRVVE